MLSLATLTVVGAAFRAPSTSVQPVAWRTAASRQLRMIAAPLSEEADEGDWSKRELWALEDNLPRFSLSAGNMVLWRRMGIEVPELGA